MFGNPETTPVHGAEILRLVRLDVRRIQSIKLGPEIIGNRTRVRVVKNKVRRLSVQPSSTLCTTKVFPKPAT